MFYYTRINSVLNTDKINVLKKIFTSAFSNTIYKKPFEHIREIGCEQLLEAEGYLQLMHKLKKMAECESGYNHLKFTKLWLVHSTSKVTNTKELPYVPHFDKERYIKAMVYLDDVTLKDGPIYLSELIDASDIDFRRNNLPNNYKKTGDNIFADDELASDMKPIIGKMGDVVIFDTNAPHKAGTISPGHSRKVLRFDYVHESFLIKQKKRNKLINYITSKFKINNKL